MAGSGAERKASGGAGRGGITCVTLSMVYFSSYFYFFFENVTLDESCPLEHIWIFFNWCLFGKNCFPKCLAGLGFTMSFSSN